MQTFDLFLDNARPFLTALKRLVTHSTCPAKWTAYVSGGVGPMRMRLSERDLNSGSLILLLSFLLTI